MEDVCALPFSLAFQAGVEEGAGAGVEVVDLDFQDGVVLALAVDAEAAV